LLNRRRAVQRRWARRGRWNRFFANRLGWGKHTTRLAALLGCRVCAPGSLRFALALANWQRRFGLSPTGILTPALWFWLRSQLGIAQPERPQPTTGSGAAPAAGEPSNTMDEPNAEPTDAVIDAPGVDAPEPPPMDPGGEPHATAPPAEAELRYGFRSRRPRTDGGAMTRAARFR
jgi:hypothetical protein